MRIAALDDDPLQLEMLRQVALETGHSCHTYQTGSALQLELRRESFDLLIVDWHLPDMEGTDLVRWTRGHVSRELPILIITHRSEEADIVEGLSCGADDFMVKPVRHGELRARMAALLRRAYPVNTQSVLEFGPFRFLTTTNSLEMNGQPIEVTHREYTLALTLFQNQGRLLSREHPARSRVGPQRRSAVTLAGHTYLAPARAAEPARRSALRHQRRVRLRLPPGRA